MRITIIAVGKALDSELAGLAQQYEKRLQPYAKIDWKLLPASEHSEQQLVRKTESASISGLLKPSDVVVLLDERGQQQTNQELALTFEKLAGAQGRLVLIIGGAYGVGEALRTRAQFVWSLSKLVFPHRLVRIMLLEQLYRTFMVQRGHPYHHS
jgi:23S rRNA (pseudouridine1915-N3)-methyltransferase